MMLDYARYYLAFALQLMTAWGLLMGGAYAWLGLSTLFALAILDAILPDDHAERHITNRALANVPAWLSTLMAPSLLLLLAWQVGETLVWLLCVYGLINLGYSYGLKRVVVLDVFLISAGFMLRLLAGTTGLGIPPSNWLLMCGLLLTLFLGFAKRRAEMMLMEEGGGAHRKVLDHYSAVLLDQFITITGGCAVVAYALYTVDQDTVRIHGTSDLIYTLPFVLYGLFRYLYLMHREGGGG